MKPKRTVLVDNYLQPPLQTEHGLAILIEYGTTRILFDTGEGDALFHNANLLNISLKNLDFVVLSHGHYDHGGNLTTILTQNPQAVLVVHPHATIPRYSLHTGKPVKTIGLTPKNRKALVEHPHIIWCTTPTEITPGFWVSGEIPRRTDFEDTGGPFYTDTQKKHPDLILDDMSAWYEDDKHIHVLCGCSHAGIVNIITYIQSITSKPIKTLTGGLHLVHSDEQRFNKTKAFLEKNIASVSPCHCSGELARSYFSDI